MSHLAAAIWSEAEICKAYPNRKAGRAQRRMAGNDQGD